MFGAPPSGGNVGTNGNMTAELNSKIYGSLATSKADGFGNCLEDGGFAASGGGAVHGAYVHLPQAVIMSVPVMPDPAPVFSQNISVDGSVTLMPGDYGNITLTSSPSTDLRLAPGKYNINSLTALGSARITVLDSQVIINIVDVEASAAPFRLESAIFPDPLKPYDARQLLINYAGTGDIIVQPLNGRFVGQINAPNAKVTINTDYYGSIIGSTVTFLGRKALHFDRNLSATPTFVVGPDMLTSFSWKKDLIVPTSLMGAESFFVPGVSKLHFETPKVILQDVLVRMARPTGGPNLLDTSAKSFDIKPLKGGSHIALQWQTGCTALNRLTATLPAALDTPFRK